MKINEEVMKYAVGAVIDEDIDSLPMNEINAVDVAVDEKELELIEKDIQAENKIEEEKEMKTEVVEVIELVQVEEALNSKQVKAVEAAIMEEGKVFETAEDFAEVKGIGPKTVEAINELLMLSDDQEEPVEEDVDKTEVAEEVEISNDIVDKAIDEIISIAKEDVPKLDATEKYKVRSMNRKEKRNKLAPKYFEMDINKESKSTIKGIYYKGRYGIEITDFNAAIVTNSNRANYDKVVVFLGDKTDRWDVWGRYSGSLAKGDDKARFEFYKTGRNISVTYWRMNEYKALAKKLAVAAINKLYEAYKK
jgi:hypothetical protein